VEWAFVPFSEKAHAKRLSFLPACTCVEWAFVPTAEKAHAKRLTFFACVYLCGAGIYSECEVECVHASRVQQMFFKKGLCTPKAWAWVNKGFYV
jgi:hypothetical protein